MSTNHPDPVNVTGSWRNEATGVIFCPDCASILKTHWPKPIDIELYGDPGYRLESLICWIGLCIFHRDFLQQIRSHLKRFVMGRCFDREGHLDERYQTCYTNSTIVVRGNKDSKYWICKLCNSVSPNGWYGKQYTLSQYLTQDMVYMNASGIMYLDQELADTIDFSPWPDVNLKTIDVLDQPKDGQVLPLDRPFRATPATSKQILSADDQRPLPPVIGRAELEGQTLPIRKAAVGLYKHKNPEGEDFVDLHLNVGDGTETGWQLWIAGLSMMAVRTIEDLTEARIHIDCDQGTMPDDTVQSSLDEMMEQTRWCLENDSEEFDDKKGWTVEGIQMDFHWIEDSKFRIELEAQLSNWHDPDRHSVGIAEFESEIRMCE